MLPHAQMPMMPVPMQGMPPFVPAAFPPMAALPPLPPGWSEHVAPGGQLYYHHAASNQSTYIRPLPLVAPPEPKPKKKKKEKPAEKTPIGDTPWMRVRTTEGNVFYTHKERKESVWEVPGEIRELVEELEAREKEREREQEQRKRKLDDGADGEKETKRAKTAAAPVVPDQDELAAAMADDVEAEEEAELEREAEAARERWKKEEEEEKKKEEKERRERERKEKEEAEERARAAAPPNMSNEEAKALFKTLLEDLRISHLSPYEDALPLIIPDPRYALLPSAHDRLTVFNDYCRERARLSRPSASTTSPSKSSPEDEYMRLLREDVTSTRTSWTEWRRKWKKERRFWGWGTERERENRFREWVRALGERKRADKEAAERNFAELLAETKSITAESQWADVKRNLSSDPRYEAVGSSSAREELFTAHVKHLASLAASSADPRHESRLERQQRALREREEKVREEKGRVAREMEGVRGEVGMEEGEREWASLLTDAVRDPHISWDEALQTLRTDPRYSRSPLPPQRMRALFSAHLSALAAKHTTALHTLFLAHAPALNTPFSALPSSLLSSLPATKLALTPRTLESAYTAWQAQRFSSARAAFSAMLAENSFVDFWGRRAKLAKHEVGKGVLEEGVSYGDEEEAIDENEGGEGGRGEVGLKQVRRVLEGDARYRAFEYLREERDRWIEQYLEGLTAPGMSVHVGEHPS